MTGVRFTGFSYLADKAVKFTSNPLMTSYTVPVPSTTFTFEDVVFQDIAMEARSWLQLLPMTFTGIDPSTVQSITIKGFVMQDCAFIH